MRYYEIRLQNGEYVNTVGGHEWTPEDAIESVATFLGRAASDFQATPVPSLDESI